MDLLFRLIFNRGSSTTTISTTSFPTTSPNGREQAVARGMLSSIFKYIHGSVHQKYVGCSSRSVKFFLSSSCSAL